MGGIEFTFEPPSDAILVEERVCFRGGMCLAEPKLLELLMGPEVAENDRIEELGDIGEVGEDLSGLSVEFLEGMADTGGLTDGSEGRRCGFLGGMKSL